MRILYFSPRPCWPANTGARLRDFYLARQLAKHSELTYLGFTSEGGPEIRRERLQPLGQAESILVQRDGAYSISKMLLGLAGPIPLTVRNYTTPLMRKVLADLLEAHKFDIVQMEGVHLYEYVDMILSAKHSPRLVCDWHNIESELMRRFSENGTNSFYKRWYGSRTAALLEQAENQLLGLAHAHVVCSERERELLQSRVPGVEIHITGNGVDVDSFGSVPSTAAKDLVYVGSMDYHANIDAVLYFAESVWPAVRAKRPDLRFVIVGSRPVDEVKALSQHPGIVVTGTVDDVRPYYRDALLSIVPLRVGSGTRLKVLEAMAANVPVISTTLGAEGLQVTPDRNIRIADTADEMMRSILDLAESESERKRLSDEGAAVARSYDWQNLGDALFGFYQAQSSPRQ